MKVLPLQNNFKTNVRRNCFKRKQLKAFTYAELIPALCRRVNYRAKLLLFDCLNTHPQNVLLYDFNMLYRSVKQKV